MLRKLVFVLNQLFIRFCLERKYRFVCVDSLIVRRVKYLCWGAKAVFLAFSWMKAFIIIFLMISGHPALGEVMVLGVDGRPVYSTEYAVVAAEPFAMRVLLSANFTPAGIPAGLSQISGSVAQPLPCDVTLVSAPDDSRIGIVRLTPPVVERITRMVLRI